MGFIGQNFGETSGVTSPCAFEHDTTGYLLTLSDIVERVGERIGGFDNDSRTIRMVRRAARDALRDLPLKSDWKYYIREYQIKTSGPVNLEVVYTQSNRTAVVTSGDIPDDATYGEIFIDGIQCKISSVSGSNLVLDANNNPGRNFTGSVVWSRSTYRIPKISKINGLWRIKNQFQLAYLSPSDLSSRNVAYDYAGTPVAYTIASSSVVGASDLHFAPQPDSIEFYRLSAIIAPSYPSVFQETGDATGSSGATTLTIPEATSGWVGCVIRAAPNSTDKLTDLRYGEHEWQSVVVGVSGSTVTVTNPIPEAFTAETVLVSSLIDIDLEVMQTYYEALVYEYYCRNAVNEQLPQAMAISSREYMLARGADAKANRSTSNNVFSNNQFAGVFEDLRFARVTE
jgi:hypothetical protein